MDQRPLRFGFINKKWISEFKKFYSEAQYIELDPKLGGEKNKAIDIAVLQESELGQFQKMMGEGSLPSVFLVVNESDPPPTAFLAGKVDDILSFPLRNHDLIRAVRTFRLHNELRKLEESSDALPEIVKALQEDVTMAQKIQRHLIKEKFPAIGGLQVKSKYHCGMKPGGDFFDIFEIDANTSGILMTNCTSYALSSQLIGALIQFPKFKLQEFSPEQYLNYLYQELQSKFKKTDKVHIFFGLLSTKTYQMRYLSFGDLKACKKSGKNFQWLEKSNDAITLENFPKQATVREINLEGGDRFFLMSNGWNVAVSPDFTQGLPKIADAHSDTQEFINELSFFLHRKVREGADGEEDVGLPMQDCSVLLLEMTKNVLRLAT